MVTAGAAGAGAAAGEGPAGGTVDESRKRNSISINAAIAGSSHTHKAQGARLGTRNASDAEKKATCVRCAGAGGRQHMPGSWRSAERMTSRSYKANQCCTSTTRN